MIFYLKPPPKWYLFWYVVTCQSLIKSKGTAKVGVTTLLFFCLSCPFFLNWCKKIFIAWDRCPLICHDHQLFHTIISSKIYDRKGRKIQASLLKSSPITFCIQKAGSYVFSIEPNNQDRDDSISFLFLFPFLDLTKITLPIYIITWSSFPG